MSKLADFVTSGIGDAAIHHAPNSGRTSKPSIAPLMLMRPYAGVISSSGLLRAKIT